MRKLTEAAQAAKLIRQELKKFFPRTKFTVTTSNYSMGDSVSIEWEDGVSVDEVDSIVGKYKRGTFDGYTDSYEYTNRRKDIPQTMYVHNRRRKSLVAA